MRDLRAGVWIALAVLTFTIALANMAAQNGSQNRPTMTPRTWDDRAMATLELPLAIAGASPVPVSAEYYYRLRAFVLGSVLGPAVRSPQMCRTKDRGPGTDEGPSSTDEA